LISENYASDVTHDGNDREEEEEAAGSLDVRKMRVVVARRATRSASPASSASSMRRISLVKYQSQLA
jgi:hypothetical protein